MLQTVNGTDHAGNPDRENRVATICGGTYAPVNKEHVASLVDDIFAVTGTCEGAQLRLHVMMPLYTNAVRAPSGYIEFWLEYADNSQADRMFAIEIGGATEQRLSFGELSRDILETNAENCDPEECATVGSFDEMWLFACNVAERLKVGNLHMSYGM